MKEIWKTIENFEDYEVSNFGRVKSFKIYKEGMILKPGKNKYGYLKVSLYKNEKKYTKLIHRLVLETFDPRKDMNKLQCNHEDGNKENNIFPENIGWCTQTENIRHAYKLGLMIPMKGENHPMFGIHRCGEDAPMFGKRHLEETKKKISEKTKGENNPFYGKHHSEETKRKQSEKMKGKYLGENNSNSILTEKDVIEIWKDLNEGILTQREIAKKFGVDRTTISDIKRGKTWKHLKK